MTHKLLLANQRLTLYIYKSVTKSLIRGKFRLSYHLFHLIEYNEYKNLHTKLQDYLFVDVIDLFLEDDRQKSEFQDNKRHNSWL